MADFAEKRAIFERLGRKIVIQIGAKTHKLKRYSCPCCGYPTLERRGGYQICTLCDWEDDGDDGDDPIAFIGGPNGGYSLAEARANAASHGRMYRPGHEPGVVGESAEGSALKAQLRELFEQMVEAEPEQLPQLWRQAFALEKAVGYDISRRLKRHEQQRR